MSNYLGEFEVTVDTKGRFIIPAGYKRQFGEGDGSRFVLNRGMEGCLTLYTLEQWKVVEAVVLKLNDFNDKARRFKRAFLNGATFLEPDAAGRLLIPKTMLTFANITKDMIFSAQMNKVELWDVEAFRKENDLDAAALSDLANEVLGSNFSSPTIEGL